MPELPEVETIRRDLKSKVKGKKILRVKIIPDPRGTRLLRRYPCRRRFIRRLTNRKIMDVDRRGKYLLFTLNSREILIIHLGMTGQLLHRRGNAAPDPFTRAVFYLESGEEIRFCDARKFGELYLFSPRRKDVTINPAALGAEPFSPEFTPEALERALAGRKKAIKTLLLDQKIIAGIGNIYSDEILFASGIHPATPSSALPAEKVRKLHQAIRKVLREAIKFRGTSASDYINGFGKEGSFQYRLKVYRRAGERCYRCHTGIRAIKLQGRTSRFCPRCQR